MFKRLLAVVTILVAFGLITVTDSSAQSCGGLRKFYLSRQAVDGAHTMHVCIPGFHFASLWEIFNPTRLAYDVEDGDTGGDAGSGPPDFGGWVRNGSNIINCKLWTSNSGADNGTLINLHPPNFWSLPSISISPWDFGDAPCSEAIAVWCVQDAY